MGVPRSAVRERPGKPRGPLVDEVLAQRLQRLIVEHPTFRYRRLWPLLRFHEGLPIDRKTVYRELVLKGWFVHQWWMTPSPRVQGGRSRASRSRERWAIDVTHVQSTAERMAERYRGAAAGADSNGASPDPQQRRRRERSAHV